MENIGRYYASFKIETPDKNKLDVDVYYPVKHPDLEKLHCILIDAPANNYGIIHFKYYCNKEVSNFPVDAELIKAEILKLQSKASREYLIFTEEHSGLRFMDIFETENKCFSIEKNPAKLEVFKTRKEEIIKKELELEKLRQTNVNKRTIQKKEKQIWKLEYEKELEPPNEHKTIRANIHLYIVVDAKLYLEYIHYKMMGDDFHCSGYMLCKTIDCDYDGIPYKLSQNNKYAYNTENLKDCGIYPEHADLILHHFFDINTLE